MSADSVVTYTSVHSEARSWSIPSEDPYEEAARQLLEQAPRSPEYVPDPMELEDHVPVSAVAAAESARGPTMARRVDCSSVDTMETRVRDTKRRMMAALEVVNLRVSYQALARSEAYSRALEARVTVLETQARRHEWQRQDADDRAMRHIMRIQALEAGARNDTLEDTASRRYRSFVLISYPALIDQGVAAAMAESRSKQEFLKCKPLDFKGIEGVVGPTRWFEKMEYVFSISNCITSCQVKFATCTLQDDALTWWNAHVKTTTPEAAHAMGNT
ncbi:hypothetical protein Tco_0385585 [Tanacetum coccineum]